MEDKFIGQKLIQKCGDTLEIKERIFGVPGCKYRCYFIEHPYELICQKSNILRGNIENPQIELNKMLNHSFNQNCGDILKVLEKIVEGENKGKWRCEFQKYPYILYCKKEDIIRGKVSNPQIEIEEFIKKEWPQKCGDTLKILERVYLNKTKEGWNKAVFKCEFTKYPCIIYKTKDEIKNGSCLNPRIENEEFIGKTFSQFQGNLKVLEKTNQKTDKRQEYLFKCQFEGYEEFIYAEKSKILRGNIDNPYLIWRLKEKLEKYLQQKQQKITLEELAKELNVSRQQLGQNIIEFGLQKYINYSFIKSQEDIREEIGKFIKTESYNDNKYELDIYIPSLKLGIEYNGNFWHSDINKERNYHQIKSLYFKEKEIQVFHIFEYEWLSHKEILLSLIKSKCGIFERKIGARQCQIKELDYKTYAAFCNKNHLQGAAGAKIKLGLFYEEELVQIMSFGSPRFTNKYEWEIIRECSEMGTFILGGKQKLWSYFVKNYHPKNCISYCDFSKFWGDSYLKIGFELEKLNSSGFVWYNKKNNETYWRNPYDNQNLKRKGYDKIYDCGQLVFKINNI